MFLLDIAIPGTPYILTTATLIAIGLGILLLIAILLLGNSAPKWALEGFKENKKAVQKDVLENVQKTENPYDDMAAEFFFEAFDRWLASRGIQVVVPDEETGAQIVISAEFPKDESK